MKIIRLEEVDSTNEYCKRIAPCGDVAVIALRQTGGRGTKGRSFSSAEGGLYISVMRGFENFPAERAFEIMVNACVAVCRTVESFNLTPVIRWANDVLVNGKKLCGTLIENTLSGGCVRRSVVGVGINVNNPLPESLSSVATSMKRESGKDLPLSAVRDIFLENFGKSFSVADYKKYINWFNRPVTLKTADGEMQATALDVEADGRLVCNVNGQIEKISSAEVTLRL